MQSVPNLNIFSMRSLVFAFVYSLSVDLCLFLFLFLVLWHSGEEVLSKPWSSCPVPIGRRKSESVSAVELAFGLAFELPLALPASKAAAPTMYVSAVVA